MVSEYEKIKEATAFVQTVWKGKPRFGIILGSGLGRFADEISDPIEISFRDIPHFPIATVIGHSGRLVAGAVNGNDVVALKGRFHLYEGHAAQLASLPIRVFKAMGVKMLIVSNAAGGLNPLYKTGEIMIIDDQINLMFRNPLVGFNDDRIGPRFADMSRPFDQKLSQRLQIIARLHGISVHRGVYAGVLGPNYETRAEIRMLRTLGADAVGMSTVPEVLSAVQSNLQVVGLSVITNVCQPDVAQRTSGEEVVANATQAESNLGNLITTLLDSLT